MIMVLILAFGILQVYIVLCSFESWEFLWADLRVDSEIFSILLSLVVTYGVYFIASFLYFDFWHMIHSMMQYLLMLPTWINIFQVYAFANLHDFSWGTKGENLGSLPYHSTRNSTIKRNGELFHIPSDSELDINFKNNFAALKCSNFSHHSDRKRDPKVKSDDYFRDYRTKILLCWISTNIALVFVVSKTETSSHGAYSYLSILFWIICGISVFRFLGSLIYVFIWIKDSISDIVIRKRIFVPPV
jgi:chitin synthase